MAFDELNGKLISPKALADYVQNSECTVNRWIRQGKIRAVKLSHKCVRIDGDSVVEFLNNNVMPIGVHQEEPEQLKQSNKRGKS